MSGSNTYYFGLVATDEAGNQSSTATGSRACETFYTATANGYNDGNADILLQYSNGAVAVWYMNGSGGISSGASIYSGSLPGWTAIGCR
jgi:hypothetical protein